MAEASAAACVTSQPPHRRHRQQRAPPTACDVLLWGQPALSAPASNDSGSSGSGGGGNAKRKRSHALQPSPPLAQFCSSSVAAVAAAPPALAPLPSLWRGLFVVDKPADICIDTPPAPTQQQQQQQQPASDAADSHAHGVTLERLAYAALHNAAAAAAAAAGAPVAAAAAAAASSSVVAASGPKLRPCHQLDLATSGVMVYALDSSSAHAVSSLFASRRTHKFYLAMVHGHVGSLDGRDFHVRDEPLASLATPEFKETVATPPNPGRSAVTIVHVLERGFMRTSDADAADVEAHKFPVSLLLLMPQSGRRHQLRLHMRYWGPGQGHGIVGDLAYASSDTMHLDRDAARMMLHAWKLQLPLETPMSSAKDMEAVTRPPPCARVLVHTFAETAQATKQFEASIAASLAASASSPSSAVAASVAPPSTSASTTASTCTTVSEDGVESWLTLQTRVSPFAGLMLPGSELTSLGRLHLDSAAAAAGHTQRHVHVHSPRYMRSAFGGVMLLSEDSQGRQVVLVTKQARAMIHPTHLHVQPQDIHAPFSSSSSAPDSDDASAQAAAATASAPVKSSSSLSGSVWSLPYASRIPNDADVADAAARSVASFVSSTHLLQSLQFDSRALPLSFFEQTAALESVATAAAPAAAPSRSASASAFATLQLARHFRRAAGECIQVLELPATSTTAGSSRPQSQQQSHTYFLARAPRLLSGSSSSSSSASASSSSNHTAWIPVADVMAHWETKSPAASASSSASAPSSAAAAASASAAASSSLLRSSSAAGVRSWSVSALLLECVAHSSARSWMERQQA